GLGFAIGVDRPAWIVDLVRRTLLAIEDVIRANEKHASARFIGRLCSIYRAVSIHRCSQGRINLTAVNVGVRGREHNPVRPCLSHDAGDLLRVANVRLRTSQSDDLVSAPLPHERFPQHSSRAENEDTHISIMSYLRGRLTVQFCSKLHQYVVW